MVPIVSRSRAAAAAPVEHDDVPTHRRLHRSLRPPAPVVHELAGLSGVVATTAAVLALLLRLWEAPFRVPWTYSTGDSVAHMVVIRNVLQTGWGLGNDLLGWPFDQQLYDAPAPGDFLHLLAFKAMGLATSDVALIFNVYYVFTFLAAAAACYAALRLSAVDRPWAGALAVLYAFLPYHFVRGQTHLFLAAYFAVPLIAAVLIRQGSGRPLVSWPQGWRFWRSTGSSSGRAKLLAASICLLVGSTGLYYAIFAVLLLGFVGIAKALASRDLRPLAASVGLAGIISVPLFINMIPSFLFIAKEGINPDVGQRGYVDSEALALRPLQLFIPRIAHRLDEFSALHEATRVPQLSEGGQNLGLIGAAGVLILLVVGLATLFRGSPATPDDGRGPVASLLLGTLLLATMGGAGGVLALAGFAYVRGWSRIVPFIAFFAFWALAVTLQRLLTPERLRRMHRPVAATTAACLLLVGVYDQSSPTDRADYDAAAASWSSDRSFVRDLEQTFAPGAAFFQVPYIPFPEGGAAAVDPRMVDYDLARGYLHSDLLQWSYGGIRGREADWQVAVVSQPLEQILATVAAVGFDGFYVDRHAYADDAQTFEQEATGILGAPPLLTSPNGRLAVYDLRPFRELLRGQVGQNQLDKLRQQALGSDIDEASAADSRALR